ncbi:MAG: diaminopimelate decarboxylase, partial [Gemmatimonadales bacterium]|nr:diaminopimelate decarboxylase [Gemmatimonadales bacterium]
RTGCPGRNVILPGNAKAACELERAIVYGVGRIVIDHPDEIGGLRNASAATGADHRPDLLLRLNVDLTPETHEKVRTVGPGTHFGMSPSVAASVARRIAGAGEWRLAGVHIHAGSQIRDPALFSRVAEAAVGFVAPLRRRFPGTVDLDLGGGLAAPYRAGEEVPSPREYAEALEAGLRRSEAEARLGAYRLIVEPGRSVIANAGLTLYTVHARKRLEGAGEALAVDGGLSDNPRPSLYGASYEVLNASRGCGEAERSFRVVGRHCESGDVIAPAATLPGETAVGDVLAIPGTGAYVFAMSSRYNGVGRPAVVFVRAGRAREVVRRETDDDLLACDLSLGGPAVGPLRSATQEAVRT